MATALMVFGLVLIVGGALVLLVPRLRPQGEPEGVIKDTSALVEEINNLLDKFDKPYRPGLIVMIAGFVLLGVGVFLQVSSP